jgi:hypothetical protein
MATSYLGRGMKSLRCSRRSCVSCLRDADGCRRRTGSALSNGETRWTTRRRTAAYVYSVGFGTRFLEYLARFRFSGDVDAMPDRRYHRVRRRAASRWSLLRGSRRSCFRRCCSTRSTSRRWWRPGAARITPATGGGAPAGGRLVDFSPRRDDGTDAAMKAARAAAIAGSSGASNLAAAIATGSRRSGRWPIPR